MLEVEEPEGPQLYLRLGLHVLHDVARQVGQLLDPVGNPSGQPVGWSDGNSFVPLLSWMVMVIVS